MHNLSKQRDYNKRKRLRTIKAQKRAAKVAKHRREKANRLAIIDYALRETQRVRHARIKMLYRKRVYKTSFKEVIVDQPLGIEEYASAAYFLDKAEEIVNFKSRCLKLNLDKCPRIWPSAITLLCSLKQWVELTSRPNKVPTILSSDSESASVNAYLVHSGFYGYVHRTHEAEESLFNSSEIIKIEREISPHDVDVEKKEDQIVELLEKYSNYSPSQIELVNNVILTEVFNNVREHGIVNRDKGWWLLGQYHKTHKLISLCVADNGIGIKNSLMTGPQRFEIQNKYPDECKKGGDLIRLALNKSVSGAITASLKTKHIFSEGYERGSRRGHGLNRIREACKDLDIPFTLISNRGFVFLDHNGDIKESGTRNSRLFAGTLYHFSIPAK